MLIVIADIMEEGCTVLECDTERTYASEMPDYLAPMVWEEEDA